MAKVYVIDNGQGWSDHAIMFVRVADIEIDHVEKEVAALNACPGLVDKWSILAVLRDGEWRGGAPMAQSTFIEDVTWRKELYSE